MRFILLICLFSASVHAQSELNEVDYIQDMTDEFYRDNNAQPHKATGEHTCQSDKSLGHTCQNIGVNFMDCNQAFFSLRREDCCSGSEHGGVSIGFKLIKCSKYL